MRIGIFSDIHSNYEALSTVLDFFKEQNCDTYACLGDVVGYGAEPDVCCHMVRNFADYTVVGNHDAAVSGRMNYAYYYDAARNALDWHSELLSDENLKWLEQLPYLQMLKDQDVAFCHGSPINCEEFEYVFSIEQANQLCNNYDQLARVTFIGHSHLTKAFRILPTHSSDITDDLLDLKEEGKYIITVGSVGQPRDYDNRACCIVFDTDANTVQYFRHEYDIEKAAKKIFESKLASNFGKRLFLGI